MSEHACITCPHCNSEDEYASAQLVDGCFILCFECGGEMLILSEFVELEDDEFTFYWAELPDD